MLSRHKQDSRAVGRCTRGYCSSAAAVPVALRVVHITRTLPAHTRLLQLCCFPLQVDSSREVFQSLLLLQSTLHHASHNFLWTVASTNSLHIAQLNKSHHTTPHCTPARPTHHITPHCTPARPKHHITPHCTPARPTHHTTPHCTPARPTHHTTPHHTSHLKN